MSDYRSRRIVAGVLVLAVVGAGVSGLLISVSNQQAAQEAAKQDRGEGTASTALSPPPRTSSPYLNSRLDVAYVGSGACRECHVEKSDSFSATTHSRSLGPIDLDHEPPDADFKHPRSGHHYRVARKDGRFFHRESLIDGDNPELVLGDHPVTYAIGSGHHSRSYLIDLDGFMVESPLTWYASQQSWKLSPGFDSAVHWGFTRSAREECVHCHAGRVESVDGSTHRLQFHEQQIGCESCHGPGEQHIKYRRGVGAMSSEVDRTIVNPHQLSRELNEAVCARCHLRGAAFVTVRGRHQNDFRPGLPLTDFRIDYKAKHPSTSMTVVGHFEQMQSSACYLESNTMTCTTCHNPHDNPTAAEKTVHYRKRCMTCHEQSGGCKLEEARRLAVNPQNDCISCHMPKTETDIPHFAFTHHRIAVRHAAPGKHSQPEEIVELVPFGDISRFSEIEQLRCLGLAELEYADRVAPQIRPVYLQRAMSRLQRAHRGGLRDAIVLAALARLHWELDSRECIPFANAALKSPERTPTSNVNALIVLGDMQLRLGNTTAATQAFTTLSTIRRWPDDWKMLGMSLMQANDFSGAVRAFDRAVNIRPDEPALRLLLADAYEKSGNHQSSQQQRDLANQLLKAQDARGD